MNITWNAPLLAQIRAAGLDQMGPAEGVLLYRFQDHGGVTLYIGVTCSPPIRWQAHKNRSAWWPMVASVTVERFPHNGAALDAERAAIRGERPPFNRRSNPGAFQESPGSQSGASREPVGPYARAGARAPRRVRDRRQETGVTNNGYGWLVGQGPTRDGEASQPARVKP